MTFNHDRLESKPVFRINFKFAFLPALLSISVQNAYSETIKESVEKSSTARHYLEISAGAGGSLNDSLQQNLKQEDLQKYVSLGQSLSTQTLNSYTLKKENLFHKTESADLTYRYKMLFLSANYAELKGSPVYSEEYFFKISEPGVLDYTQYENIKSKYKKSEYARQEQKIGLFFGKNRFQAALYMGGGNLKSYQEYSPRGYYFEQDGPLSAAGLIYDYGTIHVKEKSEMYSSGILLKMKFSEKFQLDADYRARSDLRELRYEFRSNPVYDYEFYGNQMVEFVSISDYLLTGKTFLLSLKPKYSLGRGFHAYLELSAEQGKFRKFSEKHSYAWINYSDPAASEFYDEPSFLFRILDDIIPSRPRIKNGSLQIGMSYHLGR